MDNKKVTWLPAEGAAADRLTMFVCALVGDRTIPDFPL